MLRKLCADGLDIYIAEAERALADEGDPWSAYVDFLRRIVAEDTHSLSMRLAGTLTPTERHAVGAQRIQELGQKLFDRTQRAGAIRGDVTFLDVGFTLELIGEARLPSPERTAELRQRILGLVIDGLRPEAKTPLPGTPPTWAEQGERWMPH